MEKTMKPTVIMMKAFKEIEMKITSHNKDDIARQIAESAWKQADDATSNNMLRVSEALIAVGLPFSDFPTLTSLREKFIPCGEEKFTNITYSQALTQALTVAGIN